MSSLFSIPALTIYSSKVSRVAIFPYIHIFLLSTFPLIFPFWYRFKFIPFKNLPLSCFLPYSSPSKLNCHWDRATLRVKVKMGCFVFRPLWTVLRIMHFLRIFLENLLICSNCVFCVVMLQNDKNHFNLSKTYLVFDLTVNVSTSG